MEGGIVDITLKDAGRSNLSRMEGGIVDIRIKDAGYNVKEMRNNKIKTNG
jgi:hypothetical protein